MSNLLEYASKRLDAYVPNLPNKEGEKYRRNNLDF